MKVKSYKFQPRTDSPEAKKVKSERDKGYKRTSIFALFILSFIFILSFYSSAYGVDFSCPGGQWAQVSNCHREYYIYHHYEYITYHGDRKYVYGSDDRSPEEPYPATCIHWTAEAKPFSCSGEGIIQGPDTGHGRSICYIYTPNDWVCALLSLVVYQWQCPAVCTNGQTISCYSGPGGTENVGICKGGTQTCTGGQWGTCVGEVLPQAEICGDNIDNNCDGQVDEGCGCGYTITNLPSKIIGQCELAWKSKPNYDLTSSSICSQGCAMASLTMLMQQQGCNVDMLSVNSCSQCFGKSGAIDWSKVLNIFCPNPKYLASKSKNAASYGKPHIPIPESLVKEINEGLKNGDLYLLKVGSPNSPGGYRQHFVFVIGTTDDCKGLRVYDPATGKEKIYYNYKGFRKFKGL